MRCNTLKRLPLVESLKRIIHSLFKRNRLNLAFKCTLLLATCYLLPLFALSAAATPMSPQPHTLAYVLQAENLGKDREQAVVALKVCGRDWLVLDLAFSNDNLWRAEEITAIRQIHPGRKALAYLSIGEAEDYRDYWQPQWNQRNADGKTAAPAWLGAENPDWRGNFCVNYWDPEWQAIILKQADKAIGIEDLYTNGDKVQPADHVKYVRGFLKPLQQAGKPLFVIEYGTSKKAQQHSQRSAAADGAVLLITDRLLQTIGTSYYNTK